MSVGQMLEHQFDRLSPEEQRVLEAASVAGVEYSAAAVAAALAAELAAVETWCEGLVRRQQLLRSAGMAEWPDGTAAACYGLRHTLYRDYVYARVTPSRRAQLHRRIGERLEAAYGPRVGEIAAELATHFERGGDARRAVQYLRHAAENAIRRYANREAIDYLTQALTVQGRLSDAERASVHPRVLEQLGLARLAMGNMPASADAFEALAADARNKGDFEGEANALVHLISPLYWGDHERCLATVDRALAVSERIEDGLLRTHTRGCCAFWNLELRGWREEDAQACAAAVEAARRAGDRVLLSRHLAHAAYFQCLRSEYRSSCQTAEEGLQLALEVGHAYYYLICQCYRARALLHRGEWGEMVRVLTEALAMAERNGHRLWTMHLRLLMAWLHEEACAFDAARALCEHALTQAQEVDYGYGIRLSLILLGRAHLGLGDNERAFDSFSEASQRRDLGQGSIDWILEMQLRHGLSEYWLARKELGRASQEAERHCELAAQPGERTYLAIGRRALAEIALAGRKWDQADAEISGALAILEGEEAPLAAWRVYATAARVHQQQGRRAEAERYWRQSAAILHRLAASLGDALELRQSLLTHPPVRAIVRRARSGSGSS